MLSPTYPINALPHAPARTPTTFPAAAQAFNLSKDTLYSTGNKLAPHVSYRIHQYSFQGARQVVGALEANQCEFTIHIQDSDQFVTLPFVTPRGVRVELHGTLNYRSGGAPQGIFMRLDIECFDNLWQITAIFVAGGPLPTHMHAGSFPNVTHAGGHGQAQLTGNYRQSDS